MNIEFTSVVVVVVLALLVLAARAFLEDQRLMSIAEQKAKTKIVHILRVGRTLCEFSDKTPREWPDEHFWVEITNKHDATCEHCLAIAKGENDNG